MLEQPPTLGAPVSGDLRADLVRYLGDHQKLIEVDALTLLLSSPEPLLLCRKVIADAGPGVPFVTRTMVERAIARPGAAPVAGGASLPGPRPSAAGPPPPFELIAQGFRDGPTGAEPLGAYGALFASRFQSLKRILRGRPELPNLVPVEELPRTEGTASLIGMVRQVRITPEERHVILELEDETGSVEVMIPRDRPEARGQYIVDEVVGVQLAPRRDRRRIAIGVGVSRPEVPYRRDPGIVGATGRVMFLSDLHIGSRSFLEENWSGLVEFLRGEGPMPELAGAISHVVIAGDLVDGIGIYPGQEAELALHDIFEQYLELGRRLAELPERLEIVAVPGNHDAVCPAEPQPALPAELSESLPKNVRLLGNPSTFAIRGVLIEAYHGRSFDDLIPAIPGASYARPTEVMKRMLQMRHLAPIYGGRTPLAPLATDGLLLDPVPDILVTGHAHTFGVDRYRGVLLLNASTWQAETAYQRMRNIAPVPARAAVVDLADRSLTALDFSGRRAAVEPPGRA